MKKIILLVFTGILCSQVVYSADAEREALLESIAAARAETDRLKQQIADAQAANSPYAWASWLVGGCVGGVKRAVGSCFGCCASTAEYVAEHPCSACFRLAACCCCCGLASGAVMGTEMLEPGVAAVCHLCKDAAYGCSVVTACCAANTCGVQRAMTVCASCVAGLARRGQHACLPAEHME